MSLSELVRDPLARSRLSVEEAKRAEIDEDWLSEFVLESGKNILTVGWDSNFPGGSSARSLRGIILAPK